MSNVRSKSSLERFLGIFTEVQAGEGPTAVLVTINVFLVLTSYYIAKVVREPLILAGGGAELKSYASAGQAILLLLVAVPLYSRLASRLPRRHLINIVTLFFSACLVLFYILAQLQVPLGLIFFLWVGIFNLMIIAQIWAFANDLYTPETGKRIFPIVAFGASAGAVFGSFIAGRLIDRLGIYQLLLVATGLLALSLVITNYVDFRERYRTKEVAAVRSTPAEERIGKGGAFKLVFTHKYLLLIAFLILFLNWVNTTGEYILGRVVSQAAENAVASDSTGAISEAGFIGKFYADFFTVVNFAGLMIQLFIVSRIFKYLGIRIAILFLPMIALAGYALLAFYPVLSVIRWAKTAENATDYSLQNTVRHALFLPTTREQKYKAKQAIDSFFWRAGDVLSAVLVYFGLHWLYFETREFALVNLGLVLVWLVIAILIGNENRKLTNSETKGVETDFADSKPD